MLCSSVLCLLLLLPDPPRPPPHVTHTHSAHTWCRSRHDSTIHTHSQDSQALDTHSLTQVGTLPYTAITLHSCSLTDSLTCDSLTHTHSLTLTHTRLTDSLTSLTHSHSLTLTHSHSLTLTHTHSLALHVMSLTHCTRILRRQAKGHRMCTATGVRIPRPWQSLRCPLVSARFCGGRPRDTGCALPRAYGSVRPWQSLRCPLVSCHAKCVCSA